MNSIQKEFLEKRKFRQTWKRVAQQFYSKKLPSPLPVFAKKLHVNEVVFAPMLIDGCLATDLTGFRIYVNCEKNEKNEFQSAYNKGEDKILPPHLRFTIAHEISHTLFFRIGEKRPSEKTKAKSSAKISGLEELCNEIASELLLPSPAIDLFAAKNDLLVPKNLRHLAEQAAVPAEVVFHRIMAKKELLHSAGAIALIQWKSNKPIIIRFFQNGEFSALGMFSDKIENIPFCEIIDDERFILNGGIKNLIQIYRRDKIKRDGSLNGIEVECETGKHHSISFVTFRKIPPL